jgi:hypothetical protein
MTIGKVKTRRHYSAQSEARCLVDLLAEKKLKIDV